MKVERESTNTTERSFFVVPRVDNLINLSGRVLEIIIIQYGQACTWVLLQCLPCLSGHVLHGSIRGCRNSVSQIGPKALRLHCPHWQAWKATESSRTERNAARVGFFQNAGRIVIIVMRTIYEKLFQNMFSSSMMPSLQATVKPFPLPNHQKHCPRLVALKC